MFKDILEKVLDYGDEIFQKVSDDTKDILEEVYYDSDDISEKVSNNAKDIIDDQANNCLLHFYKRCVSLKVVYQSLVNSFFRAKESLLK